MMDLRPPGSSTPQRSIAGLCLVVSLAMSACSSNAARDARMSRDLAHLMGWSDTDEVLQHTEHDVRLEGVRALAAVDDELVIPFLIDALDDVDMRVRRDAARALGDRGSDANDAVPTLARLLEDPGAIVRTSALDALGRIGGRDSSVALIAHLRRVDRPHYEEVLLALGNTGDEGAVNEIAPFLSDHDPFVRRAATVALVRLGGASVGVFRERLRLDEPGERCEAARALAWTGSRSDISSLRAVAADDPSPLVRTCVLGAAGRLGDDEAVPLLVEQLRGGTIETRELAADALAQVGDPSVVGALADALTDFPIERDHPNAALRALIGLGELARRELLDRLVGASPEEQVLLARALASIGVAEDVAALEVALAQAAHDEARSALRDAVTSIEYRSSPR